MSNPFGDVTQRVRPERITHKQIIESPQLKLVLDEKEYDTLISTTPNVLNREYWLSHASAITVTDFLKGQEGQHLFILGNGNTTLTHGTNIFTSTGANKVLAANKMYHLVYHLAKWYEVTT